MRIALLITNYAVAVFLALALVGSMMPPADEGAGLTVFVVALIAPAVILSIIYAHKTKEE